MVDVARVEDKSGTGGLGRAGGAQSPPASVMAVQRQTSHCTAKTALLRIAKLPRFAGPGKERRQGIGKLVAGIGGPVVSLGRKSPFIRTPPVPCDLGRDGFVDSHDYTHTGWVDGISESPDDISGIRRNPGCQVSGFAPPHALVAGGAPGEVRALAREQPE